MCSNGIKTFEKIIERGSGLFRVGREVIWSTIVPPINQIRVLLYDSSFGGVYTHLNSISWFKIMIYDDNEKCDDSIQF